MQKSLVEHQQTLPEATEKHLLIVSHAFEVITDLFLGHEQMVLLRRDVRL